MGKKRQTQRTAMQANGVEKQKDSDADIDADGLGLTPAAALVATSKLLATAKELYRNRTLRGGSEDGDARLDDDDSDGEHAQMFSASERWSSARAHRWRWRWSLTDGYIRCIPSPPLIFSTNAICTILIGYKAWRHRRLTKSLNMPKNSLRTSTNKLLSILVESGFIPCLFWLTQLILFFIFGPQSPTACVYEFLASMGDQISGVYPTLIVV
ncbi:hypothetical protein C8R47DRAFT_1319166 [Mycena vitilis]|nr:hypothetical protein C8R47DRAFT_1319166 [Mycena vitilis]